jgi:hypothetical protein
MEVFSIQLPTAEMMRGLKFRNKKAAALALRLGWRIGATDQ